MDEQKWLDGIDPRPMLDYIDPRGMPKMDLRKLRLFVAACQTEIWQYHKGPRSPEMKAIRSIYDFIEGGDELAMMDAWRRSSLHQPGIAFGTVAGTRIFSETCLTITRPVLLYNLANVIREIYGNPYRPVTLCGMTDDESFPHSNGAPEWNGCKLCLRIANDHNVRNLAKTMYDEHDFSQMPILADALEDAGCANGDMLSHCRSAIRWVGHKWNRDRICRCCGSTQVDVRAIRKPFCVDECHRHFHTRGCWVLDQLLAKMDE